MFKPPYIMAARKQTTAEQERYPSAPKVDPRKGYRYETCCIHANGEDINHMVEHAREVTYRTLMRHCDGLLQWSDKMKYDRRRDAGLTLAQDWCATFHKSKYKGKPCYYVCHSGIEYIWVKKET